MRQDHSRQGSTRWAQQSPQLAEVYDREAIATDWHAPALAFGLLYSATRPGERLLDIGIGTGLSAEPFRKAGLQVHGMDISEAMLAICREKGFTHLIQHDVTKAPYPHDTASMDHAVSVGVLYYLQEGRIIMQETARVLRPGGQFAFIVAHQAPGEPDTFVVDAADADLAAPVTRFRHSPERIAGWLEGAGLTLRTTLDFITLMGRRETAPVAVRAYVVQKELE